MVRWLLGVLLVGLLSVTLLQPVRAQEDVWCYTFDFSAGLQGWTLNENSIYESGQIVGANYYDGLSSTSRASAYLDIEPETELTSWVITFDYKWDGYALNQTFHQTDEIPHGIDATFPAGEYADEVYISGDIGPWELGYIELGHEINTGAGDVGAMGQYTRISVISLYGLGENPFGENDEGCGEGVGGDKTRPLADADEHPDWGIFDYTYINTLDEAYDPNDIVTAYSSTPGAPVAAVADGTVVSVQPFIASDCINGVTVGSLFLCAAIVPAALSDSSFHQLYSLDMVGAYKVIVEDADDPNILYTYILSSPTVAAGDEVVAGCILGETIELKQMPFPNFEPSIFDIGISVGLGFLSGEVNAGVTYVYAFQDGDVTQLYPSLVLPPSLEECVADQLSACINANAELNSLDYWIADSDVGMLESGDGVYIPRFQYIIQNNIMIDPEETYTLSVQARAVTAGGDDDFVTMNLQITSLIEEFSVTTDWRNYTLETTGEDWYQDSVASIVVSNQQSSAAELEVRYICLSPVTASTAPGSCYFANHQFDQDGTGWAFSGTTFNFGQAFMRHEDTLTQTVLLKPDDESTSHTYTIRAVARLLANGLYTGQVGKEVVLNYQYPSTESFIEVGTIDSAAVLADGLNPVTGAVTLDYAYTLETTIEIEEDTDSNFTFQVEVTDGDNYIQGMRLDSVCIDPSGDGTFPGQDGDGGYEPPFIEACSTVPVPLEGSVGAWTFYHWSQLKRFFYCDLMKLLNNWFKQFEALRRLIMGVARWWIALVHHISRWIGTVFMWLDGSFRNLIGGQVTTIIAGGGCHDIFCAIVDVVSTLANFFTPIVAALESIVAVLLGVLVGTVNLFFTIIGGLVAFAVALIIKLLSFFQLAGTLLTTIIGAYNTATPTAIAGLPMCAVDPDSSQLCWMVWLTDNTIFSGRWGILWAVFLSILAVLLIIWAIREFKEVLLKTWGSS